MSGTVGVANAFLTNTGFNPGISPSSMPEGSIHNKTVEDKVASVLLIVIGAIVFITTVAVYDVMRNWIEYTYVVAVVESGLYTNRKSKRMLLDSKANLSSSCVFATLCVIVACVFIPVLIYSM